MLSTQLQSDHAALVKRLVKPSAEIVEEMNHIKCGLIHASLGISGEVAEFAQAIHFRDKENLLEEAGDTLFYLTDLAFILIREFNISHDIYNTHLIKTSFDIDEEEYSATMGLVFAAGIITDIIKKHVVYAQPLNCDTVARGMIALVKGIESFLTHFGFTLDQAVQHNIDKLNRRYPEGYTDAAAKERADKPAGE